MTIIYRMDWGNSYGLLQPPRCCLPSRQEIRPSGRFDGKTSDANSERTLNEFDRNNQRSVIIDRRQNPHDSIQTATADSDAFSDIQKWMRPKRDTLRKQGANCTDFGVRHGQPCSALSYKTSYAGRPHHGNARCGGRANPHEGVLGKQRRLHQPPAIAPLALLAAQRKKDPHAFIAKLSRHFFLVARPGLDREPSVFGFNC